MTDPRTTSSYRKLSAAYKQRCRQAQRPCIHCGQRIDYTLNWNDPQAFTVEHVKPVSTHPHLVEDTSNWEPAHRTCNSSRGLSPVTQGLGNTSENW